MLSNSTPTAKEDQWSIQLWHEFKAGNREALGHLAQYYYRALYNYATKFTHNSELIRDSIQDVFLELWDRREFVSQTDFVKSYLLKSLRNTLFKAYQRQQRSLLTYELDFDAHHEDTIESQLIENETRTQQIQQLNQAISQLSKRQQEALYLRFYQKLSNEEIAETMGIERQSVANLVHRSLNQIKDIMGDVGPLLLLFLWC